MLPPLLELTTEPIPHPHSLQNKDLKSRLANVEGFQKPSASLSQLESQNRELQERLQAEDRCGDTFHAHLAFWPDVGSSECSRGPRLRAATAARPYPAAPGRRRCCSPPTGNWSAE